MLGSHMWGTAMLPQGQPKGMWDKGDNPHWGCFIRHSNQIFTLSDILPVDKCLIANIYRVIPYLWIKKC